MSLYILNIVLPITSSAFDPRIDRSIDAKKVFLAMLCTSNSTPLVHMNVVLRSTINTNGGTENFNSEV